MTKSLLFLAFLCLQTVTFAQSDLQKIAIGTDGSVFTFGVFDGYTSFNNGTAFGDSTQYYTNYFLAKHTPNGQVEWAKEIKGLPAVYYGVAPGIGITVDNTNNPIVTGAFYSTIVFENDTVLATPNYGFFVMKFNANGELTWSRKSNSNTLSRGCDIVVDGANNIYTAGEGDSNLYILKYNSIGAEQWYRTIEDNCVHTMYDLAISSTGKIALSCHIFNTGTVYTTNWSTTITDAMYVAFLDENGNHLGVNMIDNENFSYIENTEFDSQENYYVSGRFNQIIDFGNGSAPTLTSAGPGFQHQFLAKYSLSDTDIWASTYQTNITVPQEGFSGGLSIHNDTLNYLMNGYYIAQIPNLPAIDLGDKGTLFTKIDQDGLGICQTLIDLMQFGEDVATDTAGNSYVIGLSKANTFLVVKIDNNCTIIWQDTISSSVYSDPIGLNEKETEFVVFPNPTANNFSIKSTEGISSITIWSMEGTLVQTVELNGMKSKEIIFNGQSGMYTISVSHINGKQTTQRLIKL